MSDVKCDICGSAAIVHETSIRNGIKREVHLCADHAQQAGIALPGQQPIDKILTHFVKSAPAQKVRKACPSCSMGFTEFRQCGVLGCPDCYEAFEEQLAPMIERAQDGGTSHVGKSPHRGGASIDRQRQIHGLVKALEDAVAAEQFERAIELRDQLRNLEADVPAAKRQREH